MSVDLFIVGLSSASYRNKEGPVRGKTKPMKHMISILFTY